MVGNGRLKLLAMGGFAVALCCVTYISILIISRSAGEDTITVNQTVGVADTVVSAGGNYELGFFTPGESKNRFLGIWYKKISTRTVVWVANRDIPLTDTSGFLEIIHPGILVLLNGSRNVIWSSNSSKPVLNPVAQLLDTGNLIVRDGNEGDDPENFLWQSFDYPTDTHLPGMKLGRNSRTGLDRYLTSWKTADDTSRGNFTYRLDPSGVPQLILKSGTTVRFRSGPWNGLRFSGFPQLTTNPVYKFGFVFNAEEVYYHFELVNASVFTRFVLSPIGMAQRFTWVDRTGEWVLYSSAQTDNCETYAFCGAYGSCNINWSPTCSCLKGFVPRFPEDWEGADWSNGCVQRTALGCRGDGFVKYDGVKLPDTRYSMANETMSLHECGRVCLENCNCTAYTSLDIREEGSGCLLWFGDLMDIREFNQNGQFLYIRMAASEIDGDGGSGPQKNERIIVASTVSVGVLLLLGLPLVFWFCMKGRTKHNKGYTNGSQTEELELPLFNLAAIVNATNNFSEDNKLGEGGFGSVYKGVLSGGREIAVKRLSKNSKQGLNEFKNEVSYIAKLQHRNLVKLRGCCIQVEEKMLIYEYMPNKSLDYFIFDEELSVLLDWPTRFTIIMGIARGLLYLHQDSRLRIVHRDLKAENVLLDNKMNPKISDFGLARSFKGSQTEANTNKVVGTHGYISPEYAVHGLYSVKSDVFSFGVLVLEILSGKRNRGFRHPDHDLNLLGHAWELYREGRSLELVDASVRVSWCECEVLRAVHVGLLCVQQSQADRPSMADVTQMLGGEGAVRRPKQPAFFLETSSADVDSSGRKIAIRSDINELSITETLAR